MEGNLKYEGLGLIVLLFVMELLPYIVMTKMTPNGGNEGAGRERELEESGGKRCPKTKVEKTSESQKFYRHTCSDTRLKNSELRANFLLYGENQMVQGSFQTAEGK